MPGYKRKRTQGTPRYKKRGMRKLGAGYRGRRNQAAATIQAAVRRTLTKNLETKHAVYTSTDGVQISHNNFVTLDNRILFTTPGPFDPTLNNSDCRIGDELTLRGVAMKMMIEANERYSDVTFKLLVVKCAKGDTPTRDTLFNGLSGNKMIDTLNTERYTILASKTFKLKAGNQTVTSATGLNGEVALGTNAGIEYITDANVQAMSRPTKIVKLWIPGRKFKKNCKIQYEQGSSQPKFFDYHALLYAYSNYTTAQDIWNVGRVNDYVKVMYYKDA